MLRDNYNINWSRFYDIIANNRGTIDKVYQLWQQGGTSTYNVDMNVIDMSEKLPGWTLTQQNPYFSTTALRALAGE